MAPGTETFPGPRTRPETVPVPGATDGSAAPDAAAAGRGACPPEGAGAGFWRGSAGNRSPEAPAPSIRIKDAARNSASEESSPLPGERGDSEAVGEGWNFKIRRRNCETDALCLPWRNALQQPAERLRSLIFCPARQEFQKLGRSHGYALSLLPSRLPGRPRLIGIRVCDSNLNGFDEVGAHAVSG